MIVLMQNLYLDWKGAADWLETLYKQEMSKALFPLTGISCYVQDLFRPHTCQVHNGHFLVFLLIRIQTTRSFDDSVWIFTHAAAWNTHPIPRQHTCSCEVQAYSSETINTRQLRKMKKRLIFMRSIHWVNNQANGSNASEQRCVWI